MKAAIFKGKGAIELDERPDPTIKEPTYAVVRVVRSCVCGSDLWGYVGVPHGVEIPVPTLFYRNVGAHGGPAPARAYIPELLDDVLEGHINPGRVFDFTTDLGGIAEAYAAMDKRRAIKSLVKVRTV